MQRINGWLLATTCILGLAGETVPAAADQAAEAQVRSAAQELDRWLGDNENGQQWRRFLKSEELFAELEKGQQADRPIVQRIQSIYSGDTTGLRLRRFAAVRRALRNWLAELPQLSRQQLPQAARDAKQDYVPITQVDVQQAQARLRGSFRSLGAFLRRGDARTAAQWKQYLRWEELESQLVEGQKPNRRLLTEIYAKFRQNETGLERPEFTRVRDAIDGYADAVLFATNTKAQVFYEKNLDALATALEANPGDLPTDQGLKIGSALGWLARFGQQRELANAVQQQLSRPNLFLMFSEDMLRTGVNQDVDRSMSIREVIMGTSIRGSARMRGQVNLDLLPGTNPAVFDVVLTGTTFSRNTGKKGPVTVRSSAVSYINGRKRLLLDEEGVVGRPAQATCKTNSTIHSISSRMKIVRKIAWKQAGRTKSKVEAIASRRAAGRVQRDMNAQAAEMLETLNGTFEDQFRKPLLRRNSFPQQLDFESTDDSLMVTMLQAGRDQLAAPTDPPALTADHDIAVRFHETLVGNFSEAIFGGVTVDDVQAAKLIKDLTGSVPEELVITQDSDPWSIRFAAKVPVEVRMDDQTFTVSIRGTRFTRGEQAEIDRTMVISAAYTVAKTAEGVLLTRQGAIEVTYPDLKSGGIDETAMKVFMKVKFGALLKPEIVTTGLVLPGRWEKLGPLQLLQLHCDDGWAAMGWEAAPQEDRVAQRATR